MRLDGYLTLILLTWTIWRAPTNASKWRMGFNSAFKVLMGNSNVTEFWIFVAPRERSASLHRQLLVTTPNWYYYSILPILNSVEGRTWSCIPCVSGCVPSGRHFWTHKSAILKCKLRDLDSEGVDVGMCSPDVENWWRIRRVLLCLSYLLIQRTCYISTAKCQEAHRKAKYTFASKCLNSNLKIR